MSMESVAESPPTFTYKKLYLWSEKDTKRLLELYNDYLPQIGPLKRFKNKKEMWAHMASEFTERSAKQCEERYKTVLKRKKPAVKTSHQATPPPEAKRRKTVETAFQYEDEDDNEKSCLTSDSIVSNMLTTSELVIKEEEFVDEDEENNADEEESLWEETQSGDETSPSWFKTVNVWTAAETNLLLKLYSTYLPEIGPFKRFKSKREMWLHVANEIPGKNDKQCEARYKTVLKRKKSAAQNKHQKAMASSAANDENEKYLNEDEHNETEVHPVNNSKKYKTVQETLLEIAARREEARERRHKEKLKAVHRMINIMQQILLDKNK